MIRRTQSTKHFRGAQVVAIVTAAFATVLVPDARAETAAEFLESLEGSYTGRGKARVIGDNLDTVACKITNDFNAGKLSVSGECASTKGKSKVNGGISTNGDKLTGTFVAPRPNVEITQSSGEFKDGKVLLSASMMDNQVGKLMRVRQVISRTSSGLNAEFFLYDSATRTFQPSGNIVLKRR